MRTTRAAPSGTIETWLSWFPRVDTRLDLYALLIAFGVLVHQHPGYFRSNWDTPFVPVVIFVAGALLVRPKSTWLLIALFAAIVADGAAEAPYLVNHYVLLVLAGAAILGVLAVRALQSPLPDRSEIGDVVFSVTSVGILVTYVWAAFHKINSDFFDPVISCAVDHYNTFAESVNVLPTVSGGAAGHALAYGTVAVEFAIPALLVFRRTRVAGLVLGVAFHLAMGVNGHPAFSAIALAAYVPFVPRGLPAAMADVAARNRWGRWVLPLVSITGLAIVAIGTFLNLAGVTVGNGITARVPYVIVALPLLALVALSWGPVRQTYPPLVPHRATALAAAWGTAALLTLTAVMPYLGYRSQLSLSMFSNLRVEEGAGLWNHLLVPEQVMVFDQHNEYVRILDPTEIRPKVLDDHSGDIVNEFELQRAVSDACGDDTVIRTRFQRLSTGEIVDHENACTTSLADDLGILERKLIWFRPVLDPNVCQH